MKRFIFAALALFALASVADAQVVRPRVVNVNRGAVIARGVARAVGFGLGLRSPFAFGYGHAAFVQPLVGQSFYGHQSLSIVQPVQALTTVQAVAPLVQAQAVVGNCHTQACAQPVVQSVVAAPVVHGFAVQRVARQRFVHGYGFGARAFIGGGLHGGFGRFVLPFRLFR